MSSVLKELKTIEDYWRWGVSQLHNAEVFFGHGTDNADTETQVLLAHVLHLDVLQLADFRGARLTSGERENFLALLEQRISERKPAAYLTGQAWFAGLPFKVDERVLVPRSPIAELIESEFQPWLVAAPKHILDLCTGSACIAIACAYAFEDAEVDALDISSDALEVAEENIAAHQLEHRVFPIQSDLYSAVKGQKYDLIVTNPPYVDAEDMADLPAEFHHEPELGLAAGDDGLDLVRTILREAPEHLTENGILICEVGNSMVHMMHLYPDVPFTWLSFERGGDGVFLMTRQELVEYHDKF
ncbi:50S ribosomal protein L3 N(5)-glutamine methyltransferase [Pseudidiomarina sediminum]|uniref:Ribosomal protein uL3 glutamine methyltransferase n=1 Tax=Pseudidiomarina sediminum TaxID=431675 RepID=A0A432Z8B1_9GAMM|nr:50S ribosomal protein L3 N(5)-glutamine methyltransferase [Pseudidiomarina sediminum]MBY6063272.1 50S ribosomal protein L3 N(5)-glutamine methyltransferase [Pseudidiomarina sediminum]RUO74114.1 50S ribosomal protein L3 N(5)-glutamine methyltransferase [Pseudidiomarina sediminum]